MTAVWFLPVKITGSMSIGTWWHLRWWDRTMEGQELVRRRRHHSLRRRPHRAAAKWLAVSARHHRWSMVTMEVPWLFQHPWQVMGISASERKKERKKERKPFVCLRLFSVQFRFYSLYLSILISSCCSFPSGFLVSIRHHYHCLLASLVRFDIFTRARAKTVALFVSMILVRPDRQAREREKKEWIPRSRSNSDHRPEEQIFFYRISFRCLLFVKFLSLLFLIFIFFISRCFVIVVDFLPFLLFFVFSRLVIICLGVFLNIFTAMLLLLLLLRQSDPCRSIWKPGNTCFF
jgi:hypothetical protein